MATLFLITVLVKCLKIHLRALTHVTNNNTKRDQKTWLITLINYSSTDIKTGIWHENQQACGSIFYHGFLLQMWASHLYLGPASHMLRHVTQHEHSLRRYIPVQRILSILIITDVVTNHNLTWMFIKKTISLTLSSILTFHNINNKSRISVGMEVNHIT